MNKKIIIPVVIIAILIIVGVGFMLISSNKKGSTENDEKATNVLNNSQIGNDSAETGKTLVVYFSKTGGNYAVGNIEVGNTALMASYIVEYLKDKDIQVESYEIVPVNKYSDDYDESTKQAKKEQNEDARPAIKNKLDSIDSYDTIFIGYPIWWGDMPQILYTFLEDENLDFSGKTIIPFNTHEGSGNSGTYTTIKNKLSDANVNTDGLAVRGSVARTDEGRSQTVNWLKKLGY